jgi:hypothetical protein
MTFCLVFLAHDRGGIGIVSDRRLSTSTTYGDVLVESDDETKVIQLTETSGIAVAGNVGLLGKLIHGLPSIMSEAVPRKRIELATKYLSQLYVQTTTEHPVFQDSAIGASMIIFDTFRRRTSQRYRIKRLAFEFNEQKHRAEVALSGGGNTDYLTIGASKALRTQLGIVGASALFELANRKAEYRQATMVEVENIKAIHKIDPSAQLFVLDTTLGEPLARATSSVERNSIGGRALGYTDFLAMAASAAIKHEVRGMQQKFYLGSFTISPNLHAGVFDVDRGLRLSSSGAD